MHNNFYLDCENGDLKQVKKFLSNKNNNPNLSSHNDKVPPFFLAVQNGHMDIVKVLMSDKRIDINKPSPVSGSTPLSIATQQKNLPMVQLLLEDPKLDLNKENQYEMTPFLYSIEDRSLEIVEFFLKDPKLDINKEDSLGHTALYYLCEIACQNPHADYWNIFKKLLEHPKIDINKQDKNQVGILHLAAVKNYILPILLLAKKGANLNIQDKFGGTPLMAACKEGNLETVEALLRNNANPNIMTNEGESPILAAVLSGKIQLVNLLLSHQLNTDNLNEAFIRACAIGNISMVSLFLEKKVIKDINEFSKKQNLLPFHAACENGEIEIVKLLLIRSDIDINKSVGNISPLFIACENGHLDIVKLLLKHPDIQVNGIGIYVPLAVACEFGYVEIVKELLSHSDNNLNLDVYFENKNKTPLYLSSDFNRLEILKLLLERSDLNAEMFLKYDHNHPLAAACIKGHVKIFEFLLSNKKIISDDLFSECNPLHTAIIFGNFAFLEYCIKAKKFDINQPDHFFIKGFTPLAYACLFGFKSVVELLLAQENIVASINYDIDGFSPIFLTALMIPITTNEYKNDLDSIASLLLKRHDIDLSIKLGEDDILEFSKKVKAQSIINFFNNKKNKRVLDKLLPKNAPMPVDKPEEKIPEIASLSIVEKENEIQENIKNETKMEFCIEDKKNISENFEEIPVVEIEKDLVDENIQVELRAATFNEIIEAMREFYCDLLYWKNKNLEEELLQKRDLVLQKQKNDLTQPDLGKPEIIVLEDVEIMQGVKKRVYVIPSQKESLNAGNLRESLQGKIPLCKPLIIKNAIHNGCHKLKFKGTNGKGDIRFLAIKKKVLDLKNMPPYFNNIPDDALICCIEKSHRDIRKGDFINFIDALRNECIEFFRENSTLKPSIN